MLFMTFSRFMLHSLAASALLQATALAGVPPTKVPAKVPQTHETVAQRDQRMQWFRDAKFGMFVHWGPCSVGQREIGWGRRANRPHDISEKTHGPRSSDPEYDNYYK